MKHLHNSRPLALANAVTTCLLIALAGCSSGDKPADSSAAAVAANIPAPSTDSLKRVQGMPSTSRDPDHDFLRMMADHHKGLIELAHMTKDRKEGGVAVADARKLDAKQDVELDKMMTMLEKDFKDAYAPKVMAEHQAMADELKSKTGKEYDRTFLSDVIKHHGEALEMIDAYLPKAKMPAVKAMAMQMKADQAKEIGEMKSQLSKLGT
ncbi:hypothetical protein BH09GEM1_BH09GEM1_19760 [soil metagenome]